MTERQNCIDEATIGPSILRGTNQGVMRDQNERLVLTLLRTEGVLAKAEIARASGLSAQTVSIIVRALERDGMVRRGTPVRGRVGQPSVPLSLDPGGAVFFGLKIGRRSVELVLTDFVGRIVDRASRIHARPEPEATVAFARDAIGEISERLDAGRRARIAGLGIALPFQLWNWASALRVPEAEMRPWRDFDVTAALRSTLDMPIFVQNDASCACGAELVFGTGPRPRDFLHFYVAYFVGGGLVIDDALFTGPGGNAAAMASMPVRHRGRGTVQLLDLASLAVLEGALLDRGRPVEFLWRSAEDWSAAGTLLDDWLAGCADGLAQAILSASALVDVPAVLIDGWLPPDLRSRLVDATAERLSGLNFAGLERPRVMAGTIGPDARVLGAASLPLANRFLVDRNPSPRRKRAG